MAGPWVVDLFAGLVKAVEGKFSESKLGYFESVMENLGLNNDDGWKRLVGATTDGEPTMAGKQHGWRILVKEKVEKAGGHFPFVFHCMSHQTNILLGHSLSVQGTLHFLHKMVDNGYAALTASASAHHRQDTALGRTMGARSYVDVRWTSILDTTKDLLEAVRSKKLFTYLLSVKASELRFFC